MIETLDTHLKKTFVLSTKTTGKRRHEIFYFFFSFLFLFLTHSLPKFQLNDEKRWRFGLKKKDLNRTHLLVWLEIEDEFCEKGEKEDDMWERAEEWA